MTIAAGTVDTRALWYLTRATGVVSLLLLTSVVVLGVLTTVRWASPQWPRFATMQLHRNVSLLAVAFIAVHVITAVADPFAPLGVLDTVVPLHSQYRPVWVGLGAVAFDLLLALVVTSLLRVRIGHQRWRAVHWLAYGSWPVAVLHGVGTGSDVRSFWLQLLTVGCVLAVVGSVWWRIGHRWPERAGLRAVAAVASIVVPLAIAAFAFEGPLRSGWARRAGTPASILTGVTAASTTNGTAAPALPWSAGFQGTVSQSDGENGTSVVRINASVATSPASSLIVVLHGQALGNGGVAMTSSAVTLSQGGTTYSGQVQNLVGGRITAQVAAGSQTLALRVDLSLDGGSVSGTASAQAVTA